MNRGRWIAFGLTFMLAAPLLLLAIQEARERGPWYYSFKSLPPSTGVIEVTFSGGNLRRQIEVTILAAGEVRIVERPKGPGPQQFIEYSTRLSENEVEEIVEKAVECGLPVFDANAKLRSLDARRRSLSQVEDASAVRFRFRFESFAEDAEPVRRDYEHEFSLTAPDKLARDFPAERELQCANELSLLLSRIVYAARQSR